MKGKSLKGLSSANSATAELSKLGGNTVNPGLRKRPPLLPLPTESGEKSRTNPFVSPAPGKAEERPLPRKDTENTRKFANQLEDVRPSSLVKPKDVDTDEKAEIEASKASLKQHEPYLTSHDWKVIAAEAERRAESNKTAIEIATASDRPMLYRDRPRGQDIITFLRREYRDRGLLTDNFDRASLKKYDPACARAIEQFESKRELLPDDVRLPKARARISARERLQR